MAYVMIHGRGLTGVGGLGGLGRVPGAIGSRAGNTGIFSGESGQQRGMRDGLGPHFFASITPGTRGGVFRDFRTQRVGGLGGLGDVTSSPAVDQAIARLVALAQSGTQNIVDGVSFLSRGAAEEWAASIVNPVLTLQATLLKETDGKPFYARHPDTAKKLIQDIHAGLMQDIAEFAASASEFGVARGFGNLLSDLFAALLNALETMFKTLVDKATEFPIGFAIAVGGIALLAFLKLKK